jgi:8-oxo-dGTP pyrophosphatase MutT (NUDIX family)
MPSTPRLRASAVCLNGGALLCVRLRDPVTRVLRLFPPGGVLERGEQPAAAAQRETREETGYEVSIDGASEHVVDYPFVWAGLRVACTTHFFAARLLTPRDRPAAVRDAAYNEGVTWLPLPSLEQAFDYDAAIRDAVRHILGLDA